MVDQEDSHAREIFFGPGTSWLSLFCQLRQRLTHEISRDQTVDQWMIILHKAPIHIAG